MDQQVERDAVLSVTSGVDWNTVCDKIVREIGYAHGNMLTAPSWDAITALRGYMQGLSFLLNMRDTALKQIEEEKASKEYFDANI